MGDPVLRAGAVATRGNDLLVVRSDPGASGSGATWSVPAISVDAGETMVEAVVRAVDQQTGLAALCGRFLGWFEALDTGHEHSVTLCFATVVLDSAEPSPRRVTPDVGVGVGGDAGAGAADLAVEAAWMPVWDVSEQPMSDGLAELLAEHGVIDTLT